MPINALLFLLQQPPQRLSKVVIVAAALAFITGVALVVYFYRRFKATEKEPEEDWQAGMHALFAESPAKPSLDKAVGTRILSSEGQDAEVNARIEQSIAAELYPPTKPETVGDESKTELLGARPRPAETRTPVESPKPAVEATRPPVEPPAPLAAKPDDSFGGTRILASPPAEPTAAEAPSPFDEEIFADLDSAEAGRTGLTAALTGSEENRKEPIEPDRDEEMKQVREPRPTQPFVVSGKPAPTQPKQREPYEPPAISPIKHREPYEPPTIKRLEPREAPASPPRPALQTGVLSSETAKPFPSTVMRPTAASQPAASLASAQYGSVQPRVAQPAGASSRVPAGSVLGLPATTSSAPLRLGSAARPAADVGIGALVNYGRESEPGGKAGTIVLAVVILLVAAGVLSYRYVPGIHSRVNGWVERVRGVDQERAQLAAQQPKVKILPRNSEANKNIVTARGAVENISDPPVTLENLQVEVSLQRGNGGAPEVRQVPVNPPTLEPGQRGAFEFEYDGKRDTGFVMYKIVKLWSGDYPIKFTAPGLNN